MEYAPIALFAFNRADSLEKSLNALARSFGAGQSDLYIFVDGPRNASERAKVDLVYALACRAEGFRSVSVRRAEANRGLGPSIMAGVSDVIGRYGRVIVLEDDLVVSPDFLQWMNAGLDQYETVREVFSVCGYSNKVSVPRDYRFDGYFARPCRNDGYGIPLVHNFIKLWETRSSRFLFYYKILYNSGRTEYN